jgi:hypothetical protein
VGVGLGGHDLLDQASERRDRGLGLAAADQAAAVDIPGCQVTQRAAAVVVVLDTLRSSGRRRGGRGVALASLDLGLLVGADHRVAGVQPFALPPALVEIEHRPRLLEKARVAREDPRAVLPRADRVLGQPARDRRRRRLADRALDHQPVQLSA